MKSSQSPASKPGAATPLCQAVGRLKELGAIPHSAPFLERGVDATSGLYLKTVLLEIGGFSASHNPGLLAGLDQHIKMHAREIVRLFSGGKTGDLTFVRDYAQVLAESHFPLEAALHVYRCGLKVLIHWIRDAAIAACGAGSDDVIAAAADFTIEYANVASGMMTAEYVARVRALAEAEGGQRTEILNILLSGYDESDGRVATMLKQAGYLQQRQSYCVVAVRATNSAEMESPERVQRINLALSGLIGTTPFRMLAGIRNSALIAVLSAQRRLSGWTAPQTHLAARLGVLLQELGPAVLVGISTDQPSTASISKAFREALVALDCADVARRVVQFSGLPLRSLVLHKGGDFVRSVLPQWAQALAEADRQAQGQLVKTLRAVAEADLNVQGAGRALGLHANTVYARLDRIKDITGLDGRRHFNLVELLLAMDCAAG